MDGIIASLSPSTTVTGNSLHSNFFTVSGIYGPSVTFYTLVIWADTKRLLKAKAAYTPRRMPVIDVSYLISGEIIPKPGDLVLARADR